MIEHFPFPTCKRVFWATFLALAAVDAAFVLIHMALYTLAATGRIAEMPPGFNLGVDRGYPEIATYIKWLAISGLLAALWYKSRERLFLCLSAVFLLILADDAIQLHENGGKALVRWLNLPPTAGLRAQDIGELAAWALMGVGAAGLLWAGFAGAARSSRTTGRYMLAVMAGLVTTAIGLDVVHALVANFDHYLIALLAARLLGIAEDGGEMVVGSVGVAYALAAYATFGQIRGAPAGP